jgi:hypothetical protein
VRLITAHRILIAAAIAFFAFYALLQARRFLAAGEGGALAQALVSAAVVVGLDEYLRRQRG